MIAENYREQINWTFSQKINFSKVIVFMEVKLDGKINAIFALVLEISLTKGYILHKNWLLNL